MMQVQQQASAELQPYLGEHAALLANGQYADAIENLDEALQVNPDNAFLHNGKAWLLATCPDDEVRDGKLAVEHATKACELEAWSNAYYVDTLAAAYAESGDFKSAVKWQEEAIRLGAGPYAEGFEERLQLFKDGQPFREGVPPFKETVDEPMDAESMIDAESSDTPSSVSGELESAVPNTGDPAATEEQPQP